MNPVAKVWARRIGDRRENNLATYAYDLTVDSGELHTMRSSSPSSMLIQELIQD
jgi:hypothetical protein